VSEERRSELRAIWNKEREISVVPPGIDPYEFLGVTPQAARWSRELTLLEAAPLLLLPVRITRRKNIERAIEITAALVRLGLKPKLLVTGPPGAHNPANAAYLDRLRALRGSLSVDKEVVFLHEFGRVQGAQLRDLYLLCDAMLFPSEREGFGIPLLEAGVARLPIFCADLPPFRETARGYAHFFSPDESPDAIAAQIEASLQSDSVYQLKKRVVSQYAWDSIFTQRIEPLLNVP
jgi:glycosyltransferase involved in cell wall biosynthesis